VFHSFNFIIIQKEEKIHAPLGDIFGPLIFLPQKIEYAKASVDWRYQKKDMPKRRFVFEGFKILHFPE
jgi:hypothetical protein